jgi:hypothetical protein
MPKLRATACIFASAAIAMLLSVGAALAEDHPPATASKGAAAKAPAALCILHDIGLKN